MFNPRNEITETTIPNIAFKLKGDEDNWITPKFECGLLPGTKREELLKDGTIVEGIITVDEVKRARKVRRLGLFSTREVLSWCQVRCTGWNAQSDVFQWCERSFRCVRRNSMRMYFAILLSNRSPFYLCELCIVNLSSRDAHLEERLSKPHKANPLFLLFLLFLHSSL